MTGIAALILYKKEIDMIVNPPRDALTSRYDFVRKMTDFAWGDGDCPFDVRTLDVLIEEMFL